MTKKEAKKLFPMEVKVTLALIKKGRKHLGDGNRCIGALALKKGLKKAGVKDPSLWWSSDWGLFDSSKKSRIYVDSEKKSNGHHVDMMSVRKPLTVVFKASRVV